MEAKRLLDLFASGDTRRVDIINTRTNLVSISVVLEGPEATFMSLFDASMEMTSASKRWMDGKISSKSE